MKTIVIHSFRRSTGKSNLVANLAVLLARDGLRVGVLDAAFGSAGMHILLGLDEGRIGKSFNDYILGHCELSQAAYDVSSNLGQNIKGKIMLIPASSHATEMRHIFGNYDLDKLIIGIRKLENDLKLDLLLVDTSAGLNEEVLPTITVADKLLTVLCLDERDYQGTAVTLEIARRLDVPECLMVVNNIPEIYDLDDVREEVADTYDCEVAALLPYSELMESMGSAGIFVLRYPNDLMTISLKNLASRLLVDKVKMDNFSLLLRDLERMPPVSGMTATDVLNLPDPLGGLIRKAMRQGSISLQAMADELRMPVEQAHRIGDVMVEKGYLVNDNIPGERVVYRVFLAHMRRRNVPDL